MHATQVLDVKTGDTLALTDPTQLAVFTFLARYSGSTLTNYRYDMKVYLGWCMAHDLRPLEAQRAHLELFHRWLETTPSRMTGKPFAQATVARMLGTVLLFYKFATIDDYITKDPAAAVERPKVDQEQQKTPFLPPLAYAAVLTQARLMGPHPHATVAILGMLGLRIAEACSLDVTSVSIESGYEVIRFIGKGNKGATVPLPVPVMHAVHDAIGVREAGPLLLNNWGNRMTRHCAARIIDTALRRAGIVGHCPPHGLRRTFVTSGLLHGVPLRKMQVGARHASPSTTVRYDKMSGNLATHAAHEVAGYLSSMAG